jgi:hypothetical protein
MLADTRPKIIRSQLKINVDLSQSCMYSARRDDNGDDNDHDDLLP